MLTINNKGNHPTIHNWLLYNICQKMSFNYVGREEKISSSLKTKGEKGLEAQRILSKSGTRLGVKNL